MSCECEPTTPVDTYEEPVLNKKSLSEADICTKFITPAVLGTGWDLKNQIRQEVYFTNGRIIIKGDRIERGDKKRADYILYYKGNIPELFPLCKLRNVYSRFHNHPSRCDHT